jgi:hypothetical protein
LKERNMVLRDLGAGKYDIQCPFGKSHSPPGGSADTVYYAAHTGGYATGNFDCKHASCDGRSQSEFRAAIGIASDHQYPPLEAYEEDVARGRAGQWRDHDAGGGKGDGSSGARENRNAEVRASADTTVQAALGLTDLGNAHRFAGDHGRDVRYCWP